MAAYSFAVRVTSSTLRRQRGDKLKIDQKKAAPFGVAFVWVGKIQIFGLKI